MTRESVESEILRNSAAQFLARLIELGGMFVLTVAVARYWGTRDLGKFSLVTTFAALFAFAADWGMNLLLMRELPRRREQAAQYIGAGLLWATWCAPVAAALMVAAARTMGYGADLQWGIALGSVWMAMGALMQILRAAVYASQHSEIDIPVILTERGLAVALGLWIVLGGVSLQALMAALIVSRIVAIGAMITLARRRIGLQIVFARARDALHLGRAAIPFGLNVLGSMVYVNGDLVLLSVFRPLEEVGMYRAAGAIVVPLAALGLVLSTAQLPAIVRALDTGARSDAREIMFNIQRYGLAAGFGAGAVLISTADLVMRAVYGPTFAPAAPVLAVLALVIPIRMVNGGFGAVLTAGGLQRVRTRIVWIAAIGNVIVNLLVIPVFGMLGASATTLVTDFSIMMLLYAQVRQIIGPQEMAGTVARFLAAAAIFGGVLLLFRGQLAVALAAGSVAYLGILVLTGALRGAELNRAAKALRSLPSEVFGVRHRRPYR